MQINLLMKSKIKIFYTNFKNHQKIEKIILKRFGQNFVFRNSMEHKKVVDEEVMTKSTMGVYDALEQDFPLVI